MTLCPRNRDSPSACPRLEAEDIRLFVRGWETKVLHRRVGGEQSRHRHGPLSRGIAGGYMGAEEHRLRRLRLLRR